MLNEKDVINGYTWILGRVPARDEVKAACTYYNSQTSRNVEVFQNGLLISEEFRNRRIRAQQHMRVATVDLFRPRLVFLHIEKCGGTTLRTMLTSQFSPERVCPERFNGLADWTANELAAYDCFAGHFDLACCDVIPGRRTSVVTMLREPKARLLSLFYFWKLHVPAPDRGSHTLVDLAHRCNAREFFCHPAVVHHPSICDAIAGQLTRETTNPVIVNGFPALQSDDPIRAAPQHCLEAAWNSLSSLASFGLVEQYEPSRKLLNRQLGLAMQPIEPQQVRAKLMSTMPGAQRPAPEPADDRLDKQLDALTEIDQALYRRACALFEERVLQI